MKDNKIFSNFDSDEETQNNGHHLTKKEHLQLIHQNDVPPHPSNVKPHNHGDNHVFAPSKNYGHHNKLKAEVIGRVLDQDAKEELIEEIKDKAE